MKLKTKIILWVLTALALIGLAGIIWLVRETMTVEIVGLWG